MASVAHPRGRPSPPITSILPLATSAFSAGLAALSYAIWLFKTFFLSFLSPFLAIISIAIYLFSPFILASRVFLDLFVVLPYHVGLYISLALHPIYAFLGVACLSGAIIGYGARQIVVWVGWILLGEVQGSQRSQSPTRARPQKRPSASARGKKRVTVKTED